MRLRRLYLGDYRVVRDLDIRFGPPGNERQPGDASYGLDFLVGVNSTGKSTVLRALADLMRRLERHESVSYPFELEYELGSPDQTRKIRFSNLSDDSGVQEDLFAEPLRIWVDDQPVPQHSGDHLPRLVVVFTTGSEMDWERLDETAPFSSGDPNAIRQLSPIEQVLRELPGKPIPLEGSEDGSPSTESLFLLVRAWQLSLVTLCGMLSDTATAEQPEQRRLRKVLEEAKIGAIRGFSLKFRMPQELTSVTDRETVRLLAKHATRALHLGTDYLLVFDLTGQEHHLAQRLLGDFSNGLQLFRILARLATAVDAEPPVLQQVNLFLERPAPRGRQGERPLLHLFEWLSDGEQSFLGRLCLFTLLGDTEALILLDEPEVHFNDYWKRQIVHLLDGALEGRASHVLITTHSSVTLSDVPRDDIVILDRDENFTSRSFHPSMQTLAADPSDIMVHVFGTPVAAGAQSVERIERVLKADPDQDPDERRQALEQLLDRVGPGYWSYRIRRALLELEST